MRAYGVDRKDFGCCPGHDKYPPDCYSSNRSKRARARAKVLAHKRARARFKDSLVKIKDEYDY